MTRPYSEDIRDRKDRSVMFFLGPCGDSLPQDQPWSRVGRHLFRTACGIVPNWHDRIGSLLQGWKPSGG
jgi:hypothetical protein